MFIWYLILYLIGCIHRYLIVFLDNCNATLPLCNTLPLVESSILWSGDHKHNNNPPFLMTPIIAFLPLSHKLCNINKLSHVTISQSFSNMRYEPN